LFAAAWDLIYNPLIPANDVHIRVAYDFGFGLRQSNGEVVVVRKDLVNTISGGGFIGDPITNDAVQALLHGLLDSQLDDAQARLTAVQRIDIFPTLDCDARFPPSDTIHACGQQMELLDAALSLGAVHMIEEGLETFSDADIARMSDAVQDPARWSCGFRNNEITPEGSVVQHNACRFQPPAKRLNVYPHQIEAVLFDDTPDLDNASYAAWVAAHAAAPGGARDFAIRQICRRGEAGNLPSEGDGLVVSYPRVALGYQREAEEELCNDCAAWNCLGCEASPCEVCQ
jgi:hypothetical protein